MLGELSTLFALLIVLGDGLGQMDGLMQPLTVVAHNRCIASRGKLPETQRLPVLACVASHIHPSQAPMSPLSLHINVLMLLMVWMTHLTHVGQCMVKFVPSAHMGCTGAQEGFCGTCLQL